MEVQFAVLGNCGLRQVASVAVGLEQARDWLWPVHQNIVIAKFVVEFLKRLQCRKFLGNVIAQFGWEVRQQHLVGLRINCSA